MASSLSDTFGDRPQKESQSGASARVDPPGLEFVRAVKELLEMGAAVMENPMVSEFITSTYQGLMSLADDSYPGNDIEWHDSLAQQTEHDPEEDDEEVDPDEEESDDFDDEDTDSLDAPDDDHPDDEDDYEGDGESDDPPEEQPPTDDEEEPSEEDLDDDAFADDEPEEDADVEENDVDDDDESPKAKKMMTKLVTSLKGLSNEFQRFNAEYRRMKGKVD